MVFSSLIFCTIFLPLCLLVYYGLPRIAGGGIDRKIILSNYILLFESLIFYAFGGVKYLLLIGVVIFINWSAGFLCAPNRHRNIVRVLGLIFAVLADMGMLFFFKYFNFFIATIENVFYPGKLTIAQRATGILSGVGTGALGISEIVLPVGISFFTFQALSYVIDVYKNDAELQGNILYFALYISCFPQLIAGPIVHYKDIASQLSERNVGSNEFAEGIKRFCFGLSKKVLIANTLAAVADQIWSSDISQLDVTVSWLGAICYTFQIYYDFSGYSDMAIGLGKMFGFDFKENFNHPYRAESIQEFWRRWHISLSTWFRDYVYIPLGGSRHGMGRTCFNIFIVFLLTGIWHGANWTFFIWGLVYGILLIFERLWFGKILAKNPIKFFNRILIFIIVNSLWVVFRAGTIMEAGAFISRMFVGGLKPLNLFNYLSGMSVIAFICAMLFGGFVQAHMSVKAVKGNMLVCLTLLLLSLLFLVNGTYNPFIYYQF
ncbi:alginate O-acetyltransferase complex protein AlgI [Pseudobutyrivibrio sp. YE44]|uniref:MBOAT family O-acyltransferase n=1 Tax=Pseudobutyrivibrio sp. YE44 TaxID=1520802 RepID=UPI000884BDA2|nr:MBOAT family O-acyltransferase [Pseudobutyrivibrio sp. YE44]SDB31310.1 alginate O-acetyltransferase complex protein AlgI [Pseudobutyrivibrio sp. YE44]